MIFQVSNMDFEGIPVRVYQPSTKGSNRPGLVYLHGGGLRMGSPCKLPFLHGLFSFFPFSLCLMVITLLIIM